MNLKAVKDILKLNRDFYQSVSTEFSKTRQNPWEGWNRAVESSLKTLKMDKETIKVLDLGCGNGRFYNFIKDKVENIKYTGVDINNDFIKESKKKYKDAKFINKDIFENLDKIDGKHNIVCAFGVTHHIPDTPDSSFRYNWFTRLANLLDKRGVLILTFWNFEDKSGDYFLGWKYRKDIKRYCHQYSDVEIDNIIKNYKKINIRLIDRFKADNENLYLVFGNI